MFALEVAKVKKKPQAVHGKGLKKKSFTNVMKKQYTFGMSTFAVKVWFWHHFHSWLHSSYMSIKDENRVVPAFLIPHLISRQLSNCQIVKLNIMSNRQNNIQYVPSNIRCNKHYEKQIEDYSFQVKQIVYRMMGKLNEITLNDPRFRSSTWIIFTWVSMDNQSIMIFLHVSGCCWCFGSVQWWKVRR